MPNLLSGPKPAEWAGGQQSVHESVQDFFNNSGQDLAFPNAVAQLSQPVGEKCSDSSDAKDRSISGAGSDRVPCEISEEKSDQETKDKPLDQELRHGRRP